MRDSRPGTRLRTEAGVLASPSRAVQSWGGVLTVLDLFPHPEDVQVSLGELQHGLEIPPLTTVPPTDAPLAPPEGLEVLSLCHGYTAQ